MTTFKHEVIVGKGCTQVFCNINLEFDPPLKALVEEMFDVDITNCTVCRNMVLFNGTVTKTIIYQTLGDQNNKKVFRSNEDADPEVSGKHNKIDPPNSNSGCCEQIGDDVNGNIVFKEVTVKISGFVEVPGAKEGDDCEVVIAEVNCSDLVPQNTDPDNHQVTDACQSFIVDVCIKVLRSAKPCKKPF